MGSRRIQSFLSSKIGLLSAILVITVFVFSAVLKNDFTNWDEGVHLLNNPDVRSANLVDIFTHVVNLTYIPLTILSFALEYFFFKLNPFVYHLDNLILHLIVTFLVWGFARRMGLNLWACFCTALLFGIHPLHVESVAWVTARKDVLYGVFYMAAINTYLDFIKSDEPYLYYLSILFSLLSVLAKPMALSLPLILVLLDWYQGRGLTKKVLFEKLPFLIVVIPVAMITYVLNARVPTSDIVQGSALWLWTLSFYIQKFIIPCPLIPLYKVSEPISFSNPVYLQAVSVLIITGFIIFWQRRNRLVIFEFLFYFLSIFFILRYDNVVDISIVADRFMYLPMLGFCVLFGVVCDRILKEKKIFRYLLAVLFLILSFQTYTQCQVWKDSVTLWNYVIKFSPDSYFAYASRGVAYADYGRSDLAMRDYNRALELNPKLTQVYLNRGNEYIRRGNYYRVKHRKSGSRSRV